MSGVRNCGATRREPRRRAWLQRARRELPLTHEEVSFRTEQPDLPQSRYSFTYNFRSRKNYICFVISSLSSPPPPPPPLLSLSMLIVLSRTLTSIFAERMYASHQLLVSPVENTKYEKKYCKKNRFRNAKNRRLHRGEAENHGILKTKRKEAVSSLAGTCPI